MTVIDKVTMTNGLTFYTDEEGRNQYGRIVGGIGWKGKRPGFLVVAAEDLEPDNNINTFHHHVIDEYESDDTLQLLEKALEYTRYIYVKPWLADTDNAVEMAFLERINRDIPYRDRLSLNDAPNADDPKAFEFCLNAIESQLHPHKVLHFGKSKIREYLQEITPENRGSLSVEDFPTISALGNALAYMQEHTADPYSSVDDYRDDEADGYDYLRGRPR